MIEDEDRTINRRWEKIDGVKERWTGGWAECRVDDLNRVNCSTFLLKMYGSKDLWILASALAENVWAFVAMVALEAKRSGTSR